MKYNLDFPASGLHRMNILDEAAKPFQFEDMTPEEKIAFVRGMDKGYYQGVREQAQQTIDRMTMALVGFKP